MVPKTETEPAVTRNGSKSSAERMRRYRERKREGVVCIVKVPIYQLDAEAQARFDALPEQFMDFITAPDRFVVQWAEAA